MNYEAAKQFYEREGHLRSPRKHIERVVVGNGGGHGGIGEEAEFRELRLGAWIGNQRSRAAALSPRAGRAALQHRHAVELGGKALDVPRR